jgi:hypothetical protein
MRFMIFFDASRARLDKTIATLVNWNTHPESMENKNTLITSDFPNALRESVEKQFGGMCIYVSGDIGAVEIIGDSNTKPGDRTRFDGKDFPLNPENNRPAYTIERTEAIGRDAARAVSDALAHGEMSKVSAIDMRKAALRAPMDNQGYKFLANKGVLDTMKLPSEGEAMEIDTVVYAITIGDAQIITAPGELFPEVFYGVEKNRRRDCPEADTRRALEPSARDRMTKKYKFIFGLCPDEFGYIVPGYDFLPPAPDIARGLIEAKDWCKAKGAPDHYHETNAASSELAARWACIASALLEGKTPAVDACREIIKPAINPKTTGQTKTVRSNQQR